MDKLEQSAGGLTMIERAVAGEGRLPAPVTPLVGRGRETAALTATLLDQDVRLVTMTGPGGVGKTRLAVAVAGAIETEFADGAWFVPLAPVQSPDVVVPTIARTLGLKDDADRPVEERLREHLGDRRVLLVLDNVEHVVSAAPQIAELLVGCPRLRVLATSRVALRVSGEHEYHVPPLPVPDPKLVSSASELGANEAVVLFLQRARAVRPEFTLTGANAGTVAEICRRLDGLPLAIELAAARVRMLTPQELLARLSNRLRVLVDGPRDLPLRLQTMRDAIAWSYDLLSEEEQALFRPLAVFVGGFTLEAAEVVGNVPSVLDRVASLADKSLLHRLDPDDGEARFGMLETIREFGLHELERRGEAEAACRRHADFFLALAEQADREQLGPKQRDWLDRLELEHGNLRAALGWLATSGDVEGFGRLAVLLMRFWFIHGHLSEGRDWLERAAADASGHKELNALRADCLHGAGQLANAQYNADVATAHAEFSLALMRDLGDQAGQARALALLGKTALLADDNDRARLLMREALAFYRAIGDAERIAATLTNLGVASNNVGDFEDAVSLLTEARSIFVEMGNEHSVAIATANLGTAKYWQGDFAEAEAFYELTCEIERRLGDKTDLAITLGDLSRCACHQGHLVRSWDLLREHLALWREIGNPNALVECLREAAMLLAAVGRPAPAARALGAEAAGRVATKNPGNRHWHAEYERVADGLRAALGPDRFAAAWAAGGSKPLEQAVAAAEAELAEWASAVAAGEPGAITTPYSLTPRELEVLRLLAAGRSDREIAGELFISHRTVHRHVASVYTKLGVGSRAAAGRVARGAGLLGDEPAVLR